MPCEALTHPMSVLMIVRDSFEEVDRAFIRSPVAQDGMSEAPHGNVDYHDRASAGNHLVPLIPSRGNSLAAVDPRPGAGVG